MYCILYLCNTGWGGGRLALGSIVGVCMGVCECVRPCAYMFGIVFSIYFLLCLYRLSLFVRTPLNIR